MFCLLPITNAWHCHSLCAAPYSSNVAMLEGGVVSLLTHSFTTYYLCYFELSELVFVEYLFKECYMLFK